MSEPTSSDSSAEPTPDDITDQEVAEDSPAGPSAGITTLGSDTGDTGPDRTRAAVASGTAAYPGTAVASGTPAYPDTAARPSTAAGPRSSRPVRRGTGPHSGSGPTRGQLGGGLVEVPSVPVADPTSALLTDPTVSEDRRFCGHCGKPVGRGSGGEPGPVSGVCPRDGTPFSFAPALSAGDWVAGQYEVRGCLAHGGLGWIYLAVDHNVNGRWVVLKGLLNSGDRDAIAAAVAERRFLAEVNHPNIVKIHNFVEHPGQDGEPVGYIVMEYVGGSSLRQLLDERRRPGGSAEPMPVARAIAYALEVLTALAHLHAHGLAYCDFKPDNAIQYERQLKLIDLGAVMRMDDPHCAVYGTVGYQAPEVTKLGPSPASDVHTVGRTLAVLTLDLPPSEHGGITPLPDEHPVFTAHPSFRRVLLRATDPDPLRRFPTCEDLADQLEGVLREVLATEDGVARPGISTRFGPPRGYFAADLLIDEPLAHGPLVPVPASDLPAADAQAPHAQAPDAQAPDAPSAASGSPPTEPGPAPTATGPEPGRPDPRRIAATLPVPLVDLTDPGAGLLATLDSSDRQVVADTIAAAPELTPELRLRLVRAHLDAADPAAADAALTEFDSAEAEANDGDQYPDWRVDWFRGWAALLDGRLEDAAASFDAVYTALPGELSAKLAVAATAECAGHDELAGQLYPLVARPDPGLADAAFGRARVCLRAGERDAAVAALDAVPPTSSQHINAQLAAVAAMLLGRAGNQIGVDGLSAAAARVRPLALDAATGQRVHAELLTRAVQLGDQPGRNLLEVPWRDRELRLRLERSLRDSARLTADRNTRIALIDQANAVRPSTWT